MAISYRLSRHFSGLDLFQITGPGDAKFLRGDAGECVRDLYEYWQDGKSDYAAQALGLGAMFAELTIRDLYEQLDHSAIRTIMSPLIGVHRIEDCFYKRDYSSICCAGDLRSHDAGQAYCARLATEGEAEAFFAAAVRLGLHGTRKGCRVHVQTTPLDAKFEWDYELPISRLTVEHPHEWKKAIRAAQALTGMRYRRREEGFLGCGGMPGTDDPVSTEVVYIPEGGISWLLHEVGHWVAATDDERRSPNYGLGHEEHGTNALREWQAHAFESIVLAPFGNSRELTPPAEQTGVAFAKAGPIDDQHYRHVERRVDASLKLREWIDEFRWIYARIEEGLT